MTINPRFVDRTAALAWVLVLAALPGCSSKGGGRDTGVPDDLLDVTTVPDSPGGDATGETLDTPEDVADDESADVTAQIPAGGPCTFNDQCLSTFCVLGQKGYECAARCEEGCREGTVCLPVIQTAPDMLHVCVPTVSLACTPCVDDSICAGGKCLDVDGSLRCLALCDPFGGCPSAFDCGTHAGTDSPVCLPKAGSCECDASRTGTMRLCSSGNESGTCYGTEVCSPEEGGWKGCTAPAPVPETCDGLDNDCSGTIDDGLPESRPCARTVPDIGTCEDVEVCAGASGWTCLALEPAAESCDYVDNDCDGETDEGFRTAGVYDSPENCGACGLDCKTIVLHGTSACDASGTAPVCVVVACDPGYYPANRFECVSETEFLCQPCTVDATCSGDICRDLGNGRWCTRFCGEDDPCPEGFDCRDLNGEFLCLPDSGTCDCRDVTQGAHRACTRQNALGTCYGVETCEPGQGWVGCTALDPTEETCNGIDDDCSGSADDGLPSTNPCEKTTPGVGTCTGEASCLGPLGWVCAAPEPSPETCDYVDNDCDGQTDEDFQAAGVYALLTDCGACGYSCVDRIPNAIEACQPDGPAGPRCVVAACDPGFTAWEDRLCVLPVAPCVPCPDDDACYGGRCVDLGDGSVCLDACPEGACPAGYGCRDLPEAGAVCVPDSGSCSCNAATAGSLRPCYARNESGTCWGTQACDPLRNWGACSALEAQPESCNGLDDDCDGTVDEDLPPGNACASTVPGVGTCPGVETCRGSAGLACDAPTPAGETCDHRDNDCDGQTDEGFAQDGLYRQSPNCGACGNDCTGAIPHGTATCGEVTEGRWGCVVASCDEGYIPLNATTCAWMPSVQCSPCNDDTECPGTASCRQVGAASFCLLSCAGAAACPSGATCTTQAGVDACLPDSGSCSCSAANAGAVRLCSLSTGAGTCHGTESCTPADGGWTGCDAPMPSAEVCNGSDDDCDGLVDEDLSVESCQSSVPGVGTCSGTRVCLGASGWSCDAPTPAPEACDYLDNDCDGSIDEDFKVGSVYATLEHCGSCFAGCEEFVVDHGTAGCVVGPTGGAACGVASCDPGYVPANAFTCAKPVPVLCRPCQDDSSCQGRPCVVVQGSSFCMEACSSSTDCPEGYACTDVGGTSYCLPPSGTCGCTEATAGTKRSCEVSNAEGTCLGFETCDPASGWAGCTARTPAVEDCNGIDDDCDGTVDGGLTTGAPCQRVGAAGTCHGTNECLGVGGWRCSAPEPEAERCDGVDNDCDGTADEAGAAGCQTRYPDADLDGTGWTIGGRCLCASADGLVVTVGGDCDDADPGISPLAQEACNGFDDDCDGGVDEAGASGCIAYHSDADRDGWGGDADFECLCAPDGVHVLETGGDCDDTTAAANPAAAERCDAIDNDCDGSVDEEGAAGCTTYHRDADGDGFGDASDPHCLCAPTAPYITTVGGDCSDHTAAIRPGATEECNGFDDDCDGTVDEEGATGCLMTYVDADRDGFGPTGGARCLCRTDATYTTRKGGDCDDAASGVHPGALEVCNGGVDDDCDGQSDEVMGGDPASTFCSTFHRDLDQDGFGDPAAALCTCGSTGPTPYTAANGDDCDDTVATTHPGASEACNGVDDDCDGTTDVGEFADLVGPGWAIDYDDGDGDGIANCVDPCPVFVDRAPPQVTAALPGTLGNPWATIQAGIDGSGTCDSVRVFPGTYVENVRFNGHDVRLESVSGPSLTTIDGNHAGATVTFDQGEQPPAALVGFTVTGGSGNPIYSLWKEVLADPSDDISGGGVFVKVASPLIQGNVVTGNEVRDQGGGIFLYASYSHVVGNEVANNIANDDNDCGGGIFATNSEALVEGNYVHGNQCPGSSGDGAGMMAYASSDHYRANVFAGNWARDNGSGCRLSYYGEVLFEGNLVYGNSGQGVMVSHGTTGRVLNNTIVDNSSYGLYIFISSGSVYSAPLIANNIIAYNEGCGVSDNSDSPFTYRNNDCYSNATNYCGNLGGSSNPTGTNGNLSTSPRFVAWSDNDNYGDDNFRLQTASLCRNAGTDVSPYGVTVDHAGDPRARGAATDIGAFEFQE